MKQMVKAKAFTEGETVKFTDYVANKVETKYGENWLIEYAGDDGEIIRAHFQKSDNLLNMLRQRPEATTVTLKKYLTDGEFKKPVWVVE